MQITISGLENVQRRLREAAPTIVIKSYAHALNRAAGVIAGEVQLRAEALPEASDTPLHEHVKVQTEIDTNAKGGISKIGFDSTPDERTGKPQDSKALWVEAGHRLTSHDGKQIGHVPAHPFMRPAFEAAADRAIGVFAATLNEELQKDGTP